MKLYLQNHNYTFAIEQMLFTLFAGERPEHPDCPPAEGENALFSTLQYEGSIAHCSARLIWEGKPHEKTVDITLEPEWDDLMRDRRLSFGLKQAFYAVSVEARGSAPSWGALTGVRPVKLPTRAMLSGKTREEAQRELEEDYHVSPLRAELAMDCATHSVKLQETLRDDEVSLYVGIPFCPTRCIYCSFISSGASKSPHLIEPFLDLLIREIKKTGEVLRRAGKTIKTVYIGGGTPTSLSAKQLSRVITMMEAHLPVQDEAEFTVEMGRPDTIDDDKLALIPPHEITRIAINPQTMENHVLKALGRNHTAQDVLDCYRKARALNYPVDINMDLIAGLPQDTVAGFERSLTQVIDLRPENITVHTLAIKKGSTLAKQGGNLPTADEVAEMLDFAWASLRKAGYTPYYLYRQKYMSGGFENISWCLPNKENQYNILMMEELHDVISLGAGGITKLVNRQTGEITRLNNAKYPHDYLSSADKILAQKDKLLERE